MLPADDNLGARTYDDLMAAGPAHIIVKIDVERPIELGAFISAFTSVASQYDKFIRDRHPEVAPEAQIFVKEVKRGSIVADLIPFLGHDFLGGLASIIDPLEQMMIVDEFVRYYGARIKTYIAGKNDDDASRSDLKDLMGAVAAIANDPDGSATIEAVYFEDRKKKTKAVVKFKTREAKRAATQIEQHQATLERRDNADYQRVLMVFKQANVRGTPVGKRTGEWVEIEDISDKQMPLIYASELAESRIKHEIAEADENVFRKGFIVDVNVQTKGGRPVAYRVTNLHQVIDLPDETPPGMIPPPTPPITGLLGR